jgi:two-component system sensor histidine kinase KdpD
MTLSPQPSRPDPDALLARLQLEEATAAAARGRLRIYFGASAGVGKTFAMLAAAKRMQEENSSTGHEILVGLVETHGRADTIAQLEGLELLPRKRLGHRGQALKEFDLDAALARKPGLVLLDEFAHSNAPGSRHPKRWQDVEELLAAGIDVWTTLNVQHLESLNDVVGGITGIRVNETLPDRVFDQADEVVLVDVPADDLLARLKAGKVYLPQQAERAAKNFFRKGNLIALREIALRRTADRVGDDVKTYRVEKSIGNVWKTEAALLACIGPTDGAEHVVRSAARLATQLNASWHAVYVETPRLQRLPPAERERILNVLKLAESLEAKTAVLTGSDVAASVRDYAQANNLSKIVVGREDRRTFKWPGQRSLREQLNAAAPDADVLEVGRPKVAAKLAAPTTRRDAESDPSAGGERALDQRIRYGWTTLACIAVTLVATPLLPYFDLANIVMVFLLVVVLVAVKFGRGPAVLAAFLTVAAFDFFFVPPRFSFAVSDIQYLLTFAVMLTVALITGQLTAGLRFQARIADHREARARTLFEFARDLSGALQTEQVAAISTELMQRAFSAKVELILPDREDRLAKPLVEDEIDSGIVQWSFDKGEQAGFATDTLPGNTWRYIPLKAPMRIRGVLAIKPDNRRLLLIPEQLRQIETFASLIAIALERVHYVEVAQEALLKMESERLRNSLLAALSHDLRTPLTAMIGLADSLAMGDLPTRSKETALAIRDESLRMSTLVNNLLDMARIQSGEVKLRREWQPLEEVIGSAIRATRQILGTRPIRVNIEAGMPLVEFDAVLIERVLANLLENGAKYTPAGSAIAIDVRREGSFAKVTVADEGPGLPRGQEEAIFDKFTRGEQESATPGVGLGLAICRAIIEAHRGRISAENGASGGAAFTFLLPLGNPPAIDANEEIATP